MQTSSISYKRHRFSPKIIAHAVWLYVRFNLSLREDEEMLLERGRATVKSGVRAVIMRRPDLCLIA
jgi:transposase-like protein